MKVFLGKQTQNKLTKETKMNFKINGKNKYLFCLFGRVMERDNKVPSSG